MLGKPMLFISLAGEDSYVKILCLTSNKSDACRKKGIREDIVRIHHYQQ